MNRLLRLALALALATVAATALGASRYVTDELRISVRTGTGEQYRIIEVIDSGTRVETLEEAGEWAQVRTPEGNTGWVRAQYLSENPTAALRLETTREELESARERIGELERAVAEARDAAAEARERVEDLTETRETLRERLSRAEEGLELHDENERLKETVAELEERVSALRAETGELADRSRKEWFLVGAGVLLGGMLFGIIVTRIPWRRSRDRMF